MDVPRRQRRCRTRIPTMPPRPASRPFPGAGGSPVRRRRASPAPSDKTAAAATQVAAFFGDGDARRLRRLGRDASAGPAPSGDWGLRRMILHYAHLCAAAGGVDAFLIGSEMRGLTQVRSARRQLSGGRSSCAISPPTCGRSSGPARRSATPPTGRSTSGTSRGDGSRRRLLPPRSALGRSRRSISSASTTTCRSSDWRDGARASRRAAGCARDLRPRLPAGRTSRAAKASTGSTPAPPTATAQVRTPITDGAPASPGCSATRISAPGGRTRTSTGRAGSRAARRRRGCRRASRSASPRSAARRSTGARTSRTSSSTRSRPRASCRTSRAAGATTRSSARYLEARTRLLGRAGEQPDLGRLSAAG